ncbi:methyltransferase domain-containing protein [Candidatus Uabimicrobium sp. HlEnr_7]|uniref:methyltransferase domain-containing protein n=1 Tax=Candidatus Uabimicrobium helgolandensis TaxID=3095367 RepID=UPI00355883EC
MSSSLNFMTTNWNKYYKKDAKYLKLNQVLFELITYEVLQNLQKNRFTNALDLGCGRGELVTQVSPISDFVLGVDGSEIALEYAQSQNIANAKFTQINLDNINHFSQRYSNHFDVIFCKLTFPFVEDKGAFLEYCKEMLVHHGALVIINPVQEKGIVYNGKQANISFSHDKMMKMLNVTYGNAICFNKSFYPKNETIIGCYIAFK